MKINLGYILFALILFIILKPSIQRNYWYMEHFMDELSTKNIVYSQLLQKLKLVFDKLQIPFFLSSGTCLGYFREGKFIEHDYDIDIGVFRQDYRPELLDVMAENGFELYRVLGDEDRGLELSFRYPGTPLGSRAKVDIFLHYYDNVGTYWVTYKKPDYQEQIKYRVDPFKIKKALFMDVEVGVPDPTLQYIEQHYGEDWMIPKKPGKGGYYYATSPKSIVKDGS